jgi:ABC-type amino acid transport substrate-binding protein
LYTKSKESEQFRHPITTKGHCHESQPGEKESSKVMLTLPRTVNEKQGGRHYADVHQKDRKGIFANCTYAPSDSMAKALMEVKSGTADMAIVDATLAFYNVGPGTDFEDLVANTDNNFGMQQFGIAFRKDSDITAKVNAAMKALLKDGTLASIASRYGLEDALVK